MTADGPGFYARYNAIFKPTVVPGPARISEITNYLSRFCTQSDLANADGVDYVLTMDADSMLVDNLMETLGYRMVGGPGRGAADILTFAEWSSQVVLWRREILDDFCNEMVKMFRSDADPMVRYILRSFPARPPARPPACTVTSKSLGMHTLDLPSPVPLARTIGTFFTTVTGACPPKTGTTCFRCAPAQPALSCCNTAEALCDGSHELNFRHVLCCRWRRTCAPCALTCREWCCAARRQTAARRCAAASSGRQQSALGISQPAMMLTLTACGTAAIGSTNSSSGGPPQRRRRRQRQTAAAAAIARSLRCRSCGLAGSISTCLTTSSRGRRACSRARQARRSGYLWSTGKAAANRMGSDTFRSSTLAEVCCRPCNYKCIYLPIIMLNRGGLQNPSLRTGDRPPVVLTSMGMAEPHPPRSLSEAGNQTTTASPRTFTTTVAVQRQCPLVLAARCSVADGAPALLLQLQADGLDALAVDVAVALADARGGAAERRRQARAGPPATGCRVAAASDIDALAEQVPHARAGETLAQGIPMGHIKFSYCSHMAIVTKQTLGSSSPSWRPSGGAIACAAVTLPLLLLLLAAHRMTESNRVVSARISLRARNATSATALPAAPKFAVYTFSWLALENPVGDHVPPNVRPTAARRDAGALL